jgi:hypothetical protein
VSIGRGSASLPLATGTLQVRQVPSWVS